MPIEPNLSVEFAGRRLNNPVMTASGTCGYADELGDFMDVNILGGLITKSVSLEPRKGNPMPRIVETDAGMLNAIGLANIGVERFIQEKIPVLKSMSEAGVAIYVNAVGYTIDDYVAVTERVVEQEAIAGVELNISCPNVKKGGICFGTDPESIAEITAAVKKAAGNKTLIVKLTPTVTDITVTAKAAADQGADAISLVNTFTAMVVDIEKRLPVLANRTGGLSGPAIKPIAVYLVNRVYESVGKSYGIPILGLGGIRTASDALEFIIAGASTVAIGTSNYIDPACPVKVIDGLRSYCRRQDIADIKTLVGSLE